MTHVLLTGANGFLGRALASRLAQQELASLTLLDIEFAADLRSASLPSHVRLVEGDAGDTQVLAQATTPAPDVVYHLAGVTSRAAEADPAASLRVNVRNSLVLFERLREQGRCPVVVYASSIAVFGVPLPPSIDDTTPPAPTLTYGAHKQMVEIALADFSRRGELDGRSLRLPGIVARPAEPGGALSSFASDLIRELAAGRSYTSPVGPDASLWLLSRPACVEVLQQAAGASARELPPSRAWNAPALHTRVDELVQALCRRFSSEIAGRIGYRPQPVLTAQFARWPPLITTLATRLGQRRDEDLDQLLGRALAEFPSRPC